MKSFHHPGRITRFFLWYGLLLLPITAACADSGEGSSSAVSAEVQPAGRLVIIGGGLQAENHAVYEAILAARDGAGPLCVFPTASAEPAESMATAVQRIDAVGGEGTAEGIFLTVDNPEDAGLPETVEQVEACSGFYFSGGSQSRIARVFRPDGVNSPAFDALLRRHGAGAVVSGTSAGAAIMTDPMIGGGSSLGALTEGVRDGEEEEGVILETGLGLWSGAFVDQHFLARGRWARLLVAVSTTDGFDVGLGIDENTAIVVDGASVEVVGASGVVMFDTQGAQASSVGCGARGVRVRLLGTGDVLDLGTGEVVPGLGKEPLPPGAMGWPSIEGDFDLFGRWAFLRLMASMAVSSENTLTLEQDGFRFSFSKSEDFSAFSWAESGVEGAPAGLSVGPLILDIDPEGD